MSISTQGKVLGNNIESVIVNILESKQFQWFTFRGLSYTKFNHTYFKHLFRDNKYVSLQILMKEFLESSQKQPTYAYPVTKSKKESEQIQEEKKYKSSAVELVHSQVSPSIDFIIGQPQDPRFRSKSGPVIISSFDVTVTHKKGDI